MTPSNEEREAVAREIVDLLGEIKKLDDDYPNYAPWPIELPAGHWRWLIERLQSNGGGLEAARVSQSASGLGDRDGVPVAERYPPLDMVLHCPKCGVQHIDAAEQDMRDELLGDETYWLNPPHRSHLCHQCGCIWRPADVPTNGVRTITTAGRADTWAPASPKNQAEESARSFSSFEGFKVLDGKAEDMTARDRHQPPAHKDASEGLPGATDYPLGENPNTGEHQ